MFMYVYILFILSYNSNIVGDGAAVLLRALEPKENTGSMEKLRQKRTPGKSIKHKDLCNGHQNYVYR
jgi:3-methyladenine DNA glycosylase Mpg